MNDKEEEIVEPGISLCLISPSSDFQPTIQFNAVGFSESHFVPAFPRGLSTELLFLRPSTSPYGGWTWCNFYYSGARLFVPDSPQTFPVASGGCSEPPPTSPTPPHLQRDQCRERRSVCLCSPVPFEVEIRFSYGWLPVLMVLHSSVGSWLKWPEALWLCRPASRPLFLLLPSQTNVSYVIIAGAHFFTFQSPR